MTSSRRGSPVRAVYDLLRGPMVRARVALSTALGRPTRAADALFLLRHLATAPRRVPGTARFGDLVITYADAPSFYYQLEELFLCRWYDADLRAAQPRILDCGANIGMSSLRFRARFPGARLSAFEADPELARLTEANLRRAGDRSTDVHAKAIWTHTGTVLFDRTGDDAGHVTLDGAAVSVPCVDIAALCGERVDLLKLDIEGAEYAVVERLAAARVISNVDRMIIECHERGGGPPHLHPLLETLAGHGLEYRVLAGRASAELNPAPAGSLFQAVPHVGAVCLVYAWRPAPPEDSSCAS